MDSDASDSPDSTAGWLSTTDDGCTVVLRVIPNARRSGLSRRDDGTLVARIQAPAVGGAANKALVRWLARDVLGAGKASVRLLRGTRSRVKVLAVRLPPEQVFSAIRRELGS